MQVYIYIKKKKKKNVYKKLNVLKSFPGKNHMKSISIVSTAKI